MINPHQFVNVILEPSLKAIGMHSIDAMYLMTCTALVESKLTHIKQLPDGPGLGLFQVEWETYLDIVRYLERKPELKRLIALHTGRRNTIETPLTLMSDLAFNTIIARVKYWMQPKAIPSYKDPEAQANYYETFYNGNVNVDKTQEFIRHAKDIEGWITHADTKAP